MSTFSEAVFAKKLNELNPTQSSIQTLALWLIHHRKHSGVIVQGWMKGIRKVKPSKKLTYLYLANDVIQNSKKKGPEFNRDFRIVLIDTYRHMAKHADTKTRQSMERVLGIWKERSIFDDQFIEKCRKGMIDTGSGKEGSPATSSTDTPPVSEPETKPAKEEQPHKSHSKKVEVKTEDRESRKRRKSEITLKDELEQELSNAPNDPVEPEDLVKALTDLENAASTDAAVRERIAALPPEVSDVNLLDKLRDRGDAMELNVTVSEAVALLSNYNGRLSSELQDRKKVAHMLKDYIAGQKKALADSEVKLEEYKNKLDRVAVVRKELKAHIQSLPDLTMLPDVTGGLAPLPSAGDLFTGAKGPV